MRRDIDEALRELARPTAGAFGRDGASALGAGRQLLRRRVEAGTLRYVGADVFTFVDSPRTFDQARHIALLAAGQGALLAFESAAELHRLDGAQRGLVVVLGPHPRHVVLPGAVLHQINDVTDADRTVVLGWPVTSAARTIIDLAVVLGFLRLKAAVESAIVGGHTTMGEIFAVLLRVRRRGKPGVKLLLLVLDALDGQPPPQSVLERALARVIATTGLRAFRQAALPWAREPVLGNVDFAIADSKVIVEADGRSWHARYQAMERDRRRDREAAAAGWLTIRFLYDDIVNDPEGTAREILDVHRARRRSA